MQPTDPYAGITPEDINRAAQHEVARDERMEKYARHSRNANVFIAIVIAIWVLGTTIGGIVLIANASSTVSTTISQSCYTQGGYDTSC